MSNLQLEIVEQTRDTVIMKTNLETLRKARPGARGLPW